MIGASHLPGVCLLAVAAAAAPVSLPAQGEEVAAVSHAAPVASRARADSVRALRDARRAQGRFELRRRQSLPWARGPLGGGACDERIGRFCLWYEDHDDRWRPPPEPGALRAERERLVRQLDDAAARHPGDAWIAGQRVRYLAEAGRGADAIAAAAACRAERWWCLALGGFAHHAGGNTPAAEAAFDAALAEMPDERREEWTDLAPLLDDQSRRVYERLRDTAGRSALGAVERRFWWLADPLWMRPGNDRRAEHFSRHVMHRLQERALSTEGIPWGRDLREILLRYGWPAGWERERPSPAATGPGGVRIHHAPNGRRFEPSLAAVLDPAAAGAGWRLRDPRARAEYAPPYAEAVDEGLTHQFARFRRGDSTLIVVAFDLGADVASEAAEIALVVGTDPLAPTRATSTSGARRGTVQLVGPAMPGVLSVEALVASDTGRPRVRRARYGIAPLPAPRDLVLSDILLIAPDAPAPDSLAEALVHARATDSVVSGGPVGLYWEMYGVSAHADSLTMSLSLRAGGRDWLRRAAERVGLRARPRGARLRWRESPEADHRQARAMVLELPPLPDGTYVIELMVSGAGGRAEARRSIEVGARRRGDP